MEPASGEALHAADRGGGVNGPQVMSVAARSMYKSCGCLMDGPRFAKPCPGHRVHWIENEWLVPTAPNTDTLAEVSILSPLQRRELGEIVRKHLQESRFDFEYSMEPESFRAFMKTSKNGTS